MAGANMIYEKCGEILYAIHLNKRIYAYNCFYCDTSFTEIESFMEHMEEQHVHLLDYSSESIINEERLEQFDELEETESVDDVSIAELPIEKDEPPEQADLAENPLTDEILTIDTIDVNEGDDMDDSCSNVDMEYCEMDADMPPSSNANSSASETDFEDNTELQLDDDEDKRMTLALIIEYKQHRLLWDQTDDMFNNRRKREAAIKNIIKNLNQQLGLTLNKKNILLGIKKLRFSYRSELYKQKLEATTNKKYKPSWYYDKLSFLGNNITYTKRSKRGTKVSSQKPALPMTNLTEEQNMQLIEIYKSFPCLWNVQHIGFRFKNQRQDAINEILHKVENTMNLQMDEDELQRKLYSIRFACTQEKYLINQSARLKKKHIPKCTYFKEIEFLIDHVGPYECEHCPKVLYGYDQYRMHKSKHDGSMPFSCPICQRGFKQVGNCTVHLRRHTRDYEFGCKECSKRFPTSTDLNVHMRYHTGEKPYFCEICGRSYRTWSLFNVHQRRHQKRPKHKCDICGKTFYENTRLTDHMNAHLNVRDKICNICGKAFTSGKYLSQHRQIHNEQKKYACKICNRTFAQYAGLSGHMKTHCTTVTGGVVNDATETA